MKYRFAGKEKRLALGAYPAVTLREARERREAAKKQLANRKDPGAVRKEEKAAAALRTANSFEAVAREWLEVWKSDKAAHTVTNKARTLEKDLFPMLGSVPAAEVTPPMVLQALRYMESRGLGNSVEKAKTAVAQVMLYAIQTGRAERNPCPDLRGAIKKVTAKHAAAITDPVKAGALLRAIAGYQGIPEVMAALQLAPLVFVRPGELIAARWADVDLQKAEWRYFVTKTKTHHLVPLARQAVAILQYLQTIAKPSPWIFPGLIPGKHISASTLNAALRRMGYDTQADMSAHGFRAMARTLLAEELHQKPEVIEHQLAHAVPDSLGTAYNRTKYLKERKAMMQDWADYLDRLKAGAEVIQLRGGAA